jgi:iodotyrosine deiodinase
MDKPNFLPLSGYQEYSPSEMLDRSQAFYEEIRRRRTVRHFSDRQVARPVIENCLRAAGSAPSGANLQPWTFVAVSDAQIKRQIRQAAEAEERTFYERRAPQEWLDTLAPLGTNWEKPFLESAPWLIAVFEQRYGLRPDGGKLKHYYVSESVGLATGFLIAALHHAGLATLTHTPSPMDFLTRILGRPENERPFLLVVAGFPAENAEVPDIRRKELDDIVVFF